MPRPPTVIPPAQAADDLRPRRLAALLRRDPLQALFQPKRPPEAVIRAPAEQERHPPSPRPRPPRRAEACAWPGLKRTLARRLRQPVAQYWPPESMPVLPSR